MLEIYHYSDPRRYLRDAWMNKKKQNPRLSMRAWSRKMGFVNPTPLSLMLSGKRSIPRSSVPLFSTTLRLNEREGLYLETLVDFTNAKKPQQKEYFLERLKSISPHPSIKAVELESYKALKDPLHMLILEMTVLKDFKPDPQWISKRLTIKRTQKEITECIERLIDVGLLVQHSRTKAITKTHQHISTRPDFRDKGVQEYHKSVSHIAAEMIEKQDVQDREYGSYSMNIKKEILPKAKQLLRKMTADFISQIETKPGTGEETYQLNVQFFGLTQTTHGDKNK